MNGTDGLRHTASWNAAARALAVAAVLGAVALAAPAGRGQAPAGRELIANVHFVGSRTVAAEKAMQ